MKFCLQGVVLATAAMLASTSAMAQMQGQWAVKAGVGKITPKVTSGDVSAPALPGTKADVGPDTQPVFHVSYGWTDNIAVELAVGLPYKHDIIGAGAIEGVGVVGTVKALPPTVFAHYRFFEPEARLRPYAGVGATFAYFDDETGSGKLTALSDIGGPPTTFSIKNKVAATVQVGLIYNINTRWFIDGNISKTFLKTTVSFSSGQTQEMTLNPQAVTLGVGYKF
jgi:outer membrane protein